MIRGRLYHSPAARRLQSHQLWGTGQAGPSPAPVGVPGEGRALLGAPVEVAPLSLGARPSDRPGEHRVELKLANRSDGELNLLMDAHPSPGEQITYQLWMIFDDGTIAPERSASSLRSTLSQPVGQPRELLLRRAPQ